MAEIIDDTQGVDMQDKKLNQIFKYFDQNGDGAVTQDDWEKSTQLFTAVAEDSDEKNKGIIRDAYHKWWRLLLDGREDKTSERLDNQEFVRIMQANVVAPQNFGPTIGSIVDGLLGALDTDKNGTLSQEEYLQLYKRLGILHDRLGGPRDPGAEAFRRLDRDSDGQITHDELQQATLEYFTSSDPNAPGQWLMGPPHEL